MALIQSPRNPLVRQAAALRSPRTRRGTGLVLVEGPKAIGDALAAGARFEHAFVRAGLDHPVRAALERARVRVHEARPDVLGALAATETSQGVVAVAREPERPAADVLAAPGGGPLVILDAIQDPGNLGAILRTAAALGFRGAGLGAGTTDPFAPKVVRAAAGTLFRLPIFPIAPRDLGGWFVVAAAEGGDAPEAVFARAGGRRAALVVGNEGAGIGPAFLQRADARAWVPLGREVESLNVAAAFAILAYALAAR